MHHGWQPSQETLRAVAWITLVVATTCSEVVGTAGSARRLCGMATEFYFTPELLLKDGRIIRDLEDAASFAREQEVLPGVDQREEILHNMERAES